MAIKQLRTLFASQYQPGQPARVRPGEALAEPGGDYEALHKQMKRLFNSKPGKKYGRFSEDIGESPFSSWLKDYREDKQSFASMTDRLFGQWQELLNSAQEEFEGHLMIVHEALADAEVVYLFILENDSAMRFDAQQTLDATDILSLSRLNLAVRVELDDWLGDNAGENYLTLVHARGSGEGGDLFIKLCGFTNQVDVEKETLTFMDAVEAFAKSSEPERQARFGREPMSSRRSSMRWASRWPSRHCRATWMRTSLSVSRSLPVRLPSCRKAGCCIRITVR